MSSKAIWAVVIGLSLGLHSAACQAVRDTVYLDPSSGNGDGKSPSNPALKLPAGYVGRPGVTMLYKRGSVMRGTFPVWSGNQQAPVEIGAYGLGAKPIFMKSISLNREVDWIRESGNIWRSAANMKSSQGANIVYNDGEYCGAMRWSKDGLVKQGDWYMYDTSGGAIRASDYVYLFSTQNPGLVYRSLEYVPVGNFHRFENGASFIRVQDISIKNAGTHGFQFFGGSASNRPHDITIRRCDISYIGGAPFTYRIGINGRWVRFGNAVEVWTSAANITVEQCRLWENYDASFVVQGSCGPTCTDSIVFRRNIMWNAGFDHFDNAWGNGVSRVYFENNTCLNAGGGWPFLTEGRPRLSEFLPDSVGWHVTLDSNGLGSSTLYIRNNIFANATSNRLVKLSIPNQGGWKGVVLDHNLYFQNRSEDPIAQFGSDIFYDSDMSAYRKVTGKEAHGLVADPLFVSPETGDYRLRAGSRAIDAGGPTTFGNDFSDSTTGYHGLAPDIGAWEYTGNTTGNSRWTQEDVSSQDRGNSDNKIRYRKGGFDFYSTQAAWAQAEIVLPNGKCLPVEVRSLGNGTWAVQIGVNLFSLGHPLIKVRTDRGEYFSYWP